MATEPTPSAGPWPLEPDTEAIRAWLDGVRDLLLEHLATLPAQPAAAADGPLPPHGELLAGLPEQGEELIDVVARVVGRYVPYSFNTAGPGYLAYIPGGGVVPAALADLVADVTNRYVGVAAAAPLLARLESQVLCWFAAMAGYPAAARGVLTSGGSIANMLALVAAREKVLGDAFGDGVIYVSDQVHHSITKAARLVGFATRQVRLVDTGDGLALSGERLAAAVAADRRAGLRPAIVVASAGTTNTGLVDDLDGIAEVARRERLWCHVDAAYGGFFLLTERGRRRLKGIARADSIVMDPHKGLFLPYGTGCVLVRDGEDLRRPHRSETGYLPEMQADGEVQDFCEYSPELSRSFRGLRVWLPLKVFGAAAYRRTLDEKLDLAAHAARELGGMAGLRVLAEPDLSLVAFRLVVPGAEADAADALNQRLLERVLAHRRIWMSGAWVRGRFHLRICVLHFRTHREHVDRALELIRSESARLLAEVETG